MFIAVVNKSTLVSNTDVYNMSLLVNHQARFHAAPAWGVTPPTVIYLRDEMHAPPGSAVLGVLDNADQAGDLGWHTEGPDGTVYGRVFVQPVLANGGNETLYSRDDGKVLQVDKRNKAQSNEVSL
jgi:hypothetical protein